MPKYFPFKIAGYYLYYTSLCTVECMHAHASSRKLTEKGSAKFLIRNNGDTVVQHVGDLNKYELKQIQTFIKNNYSSMYEMWARDSVHGFYGENK